MNNPSAQWLQGRARRSMAVIGLLILVVAAVCALAVRRSESPRGSDAGAPRETVGNLDDLRPQVTAFCGDCHGTPSPAAFPKAAWHEEVKKGFDFYFDTGRTDLSPPDFDKVVAWFRSQAPEAVVMARPAESATPAKLKFRVSNIAPCCLKTRVTTGRLPNSACASWIPAGGHPCPRGRSGRRRPARFCGPHQPGARGGGRLFERRPGGLPQGEHPGAHRALACDLDGDGDLDIAACALLPERLFGRQSKDDFDSLLWLEQTASGTFQRHSLERGICQHAALAVGDFDSDGDIDLAVGRFAEQRGLPPVAIWWNLRIDGETSK